ncbi:MAG: hypothetical protein K2P59_15620 [Acetatifactor sp.]|nr:hypothetical protein [Acetatifactor sp.]
MKYGSQLRGIPRGLTYVVGVSFDQATEMGAVRFETMQGNPHGGVWIF